MENSRYLSILLVCCSFSNAEVQAFDKDSQAKTWYEAPDQGWSWYVDPAVIPKPDNKKKDKERHCHPNKEEGTQGESHESYTHTKTMEKLRKDFEELQAKAILNPTLENVAQFQKAYNRIVNRSSSFEKTWMMSSILSGENYRESDQPSPKHRKIYQEKTEKQLEEDIIALAKIYGIFFIFKKDCPYCHEMAPAVRQLVDRYHFAIKAISPDGQVIEDFPDAVKDNGTIAQINPEGVFPVVFLVNPHSGQTIPLARGLTSPSELKENFRAIIQFLKEQPNAR